MIAMRVDRPGREQHVWFLREDQSAERTVSLIVDLRFSIYLPGENRARLEDGASPLCLLGTNGGRFRSGLTRDACLASRQVKRYHFVAGIGVASHGAATT